MYSIFMVNIFLILSFMG